MLQLPGAHVGDPGRSGTLGLAVPPRPGTAGGAFPRGSRARRRGLTPGWPNRKCDINTWTVQSGVSKRVLRRAGPDTLSASRATWGLLPLLSSADESKQGRAVLQRLCLQPEAARP